MQMNRNFSPSKNIIGLHHLPIFEKINPALRNGRMTKNATRRI